MRGKLLVKMLSIVLALTMALPLLSAVGFAEGQETVFDTGVAVEAENGTILSAHGAKVEDSKASGGWAVELTNGQPGGNRYVPTDDTWTGLSFSFNVTKADMYTLSFSYYSSSQGNDSYYSSFASDSFKEQSTSVCEDGQYHWKTMDMAYLEPGVHKVRFAVREQGIRFDQVKLASADNSDNWVAPKVSGQTVYPEILDADSIGKVAKFADGDRVAFIGDSITHGGYTHMLVYNYYATRYPNVNFTYINKGINGDRAVSALSRFNHDIYDADSQFNKVLIMLGTNDMARTEYFAGNELAAGAEARRQNLINSYTENYKKLLELIKAKNPEQVILMTSPMFDEWVPESNNDTSPGFNNIVRKSGAIVYDFAKEYGFDFVDINTPQTIIDAYQRQTNADFTFTPDRVHPNAIGHYIAAYSLLKAQGETGEVATVSVDVAGAKAEASHAAVSELNATAQGVSYRYAPESLPLGADDTYRNAELLFPITDELNRETVQVKGLNDGLYDIKMDGVTVMQATASQLANGVNIADKENNPGQMRALSILSFVEKHRSLMTLYRDFVSNEIKYISTYGLDATSNASLISSAQAWIAANPSKTSDVATLTTYLADKENESATLATIAQFEDMIAEKNTPPQSLVSIEAAGSGTVVQNSSKYEHFSLPEGTLAIVPKTHNSGVSIARISFSDTNGALTKMPASGTLVTAAASVVNNTAETKKVTLWAGMYQNDRLLGIKTVQATLTPGMSAPLQVDITTPAGANNIRAGVWDALASMKPYIPAAVFPAGDAAVKGISIGWEKLDGFDPAVLEYTCYLHPYDTRVPFVSAVAANSQDALQVTQAASIGGSAKVAAGDKVYTITFLQDPTPVLSGITVGGTALEDFDANTYTYNVDIPEGSDLTVAASGAEGLHIEISQAGGIGESASITVTSPLGRKRSYTITFAKAGIPGEVSNIYMGGAATTAVTAVPSVGAKMIDMYSAYSTDQERIAAVKSAENPYANIAYAQYTDRASQSAWATKTAPDLGWLNSTYGSAIEFTYVQTSNSVLISPNVTRLYKSTSDPCQTEEVAQKAYEFDISKDATIVVATPGTSAFMAKQPGWTYEKNAKYQLYYPSYKIVKDVQEGKDPDDPYQTDSYIVPNGGTSAMSSVSNGSVYLKHYKAGERVAVPAFDVNNSYRKNSIFIIWDECNTEPKLFDIQANGVSIDGFSPDILNYTLQVADGEVPQITVSATAGAAAEVTQAQTLQDSAVIRACGKTYTVSFAATDNVPGTISNVSYRGAATTDIYGVPSVGIDPPDLYSKYETDAQRLAAVKALAGTQYDTDAYTAFQERKVTGNWDQMTGGYYAYNMKFIYAGESANGNSIFMDQNVTRLFKPSNDAPMAATAAKTYEFDIDKGATVYISTSGSKAQNRGECKSEFIEGLNQGWAYDYDVEKYGLFTWGFKEVTVGAEKAYVPDGTTMNAWTSSGSVYYKHFNPGERVLVPAFSETSSDMQTSVFVVWDNLNADAKLFDILANGISIGGFDPNVTEYTVKVDQGAAIPRISVSATPGANASVTQAQTLADKAVVTACGKTYTISFVETAADLTLASITVDGQALAGFDPAQKEFTYTVERGVTTVPNVEATAKVSANTVEVVQAVKAPGDAVITVKTPAGSTATYIVHIKKTGEPGVVSNIYKGGAATIEVTAIPSLGAPMIDMYHAYDTDAERIAAVKAADNPYAKTAYAQYTNRESENAWKYKSGASAMPANTYGAASEFILLNHPSSILISPDVTRLYKSTDDPTGANAAKAYEFDISKDATVYIATKAKSDFIASQGWTYESDAKYRLYYSNRDAGNIVDDPTAADSRYLIPNGTGAVSGDANGIVYKKHFSKEERVAVPAFSESASYRSETIFIVWDDCNDAREVYGMKYTVNGETKAVDTFSLDTLTYNIILPSGTTEVPALHMMATRPANVQVTAPDSYTNGKATATVTLEPEAGVTKTYTVNFCIDAEPEEDTRLSAISYGGTALAGFDPYVRDYAVELPLGSSYPTVSATTYSTETPNPVIVQPGAGNNGTATITVNSKNGSASAVYTVKFTILDYVPAQASIMPIKNNFKSIVTIVHDDGDLPTVSYLNDAFEQNNLKGTVAMIASRVNDSNVAQWQAYFDTGRFNLANHSYTHAYWGQDDTAESGTLSNGSAYSVPAGMMTNEIITSGEYLREKFPSQRVLAFVKPGFVYPTGLPQISDKAYKMVRDNYICMRNTGGGISTVPPSDWDNLRSLMVQTSSDVDSPNNHTAEYWIEEVDKTVAQGGWLTFLFHNIVPDEQVTDGINVAQSKASKLFDALGDRVANGDVWCAYLDEATLYIKESQTASVYAKNYQDASIGIVVTDKMDDSVYNYPITVKVEVPSAWTNVSVTQNGKVLEVAQTFTENGKTYVYANAVPDAGEATLAPADNSLFVEAIRVGGTPLDGFSPVNYRYDVTLPAGTTEAPVVTVEYGGGTADIKQAALTDGKGSATVTITPEGGAAFTYTVFFTVEKEKTGPVVILKFDDLRENEGVRGAMQNVVDYITEKNAKAGIGVIGVSLEDDGTKAAYYDQIKGWVDSGNIEIWSHGYYHSGGNNGPEFNGGTYEEQLKQMTDTNQLMLDKCGVTVSTFGPPYNAMDDTTKEVLKNVPQIKTILFGQDGEGYLNLTNSVVFEQSGTVDGTWKTWLDYGKFVANFTANKDKPYLVMQSHPLMWAQDKNSTQHKIFMDQIDYLIAQGVTFMTPSEYHASISN